MVCASVSLAKRYVDENGGVDEMLGETEKACLQAKDLTQQLLTFAKGGAPIK
ncbi:MAG: hypothetical protein HN929_06935 [Chloroflexi bacterium]|jgi:two-component system, cell cycle sensor histidine kinase and response regulator CckA|nr:hypothetical protein [Chloroflexota bacterium]MBT7081182.1 hypothetical protein [Chloroflexota bacterium]MBT7290848.1 hypothetical protein [Chloroflexota bacterium]